MAEIDGSSTWIVNRAVGASVALLALAAAVSLVVLSILKVNVSVEASGRLEPAQISYARAEDSGILRRVFARTGSFVRRGEVLAELDSTRFAQELLSLRKELKDAQLELSSEQSLRPWEIESARQRVDLSRSQVARSSARLRSAMVDFGISPAELDSTLDSSSVALGLARAELRGSLAQLGIDSASLGIARADSLRQQKLSNQIEWLKATISTAIKRSRASRIHSPIDGLVISPRSELLEGRQVQVGEAIVEIADSSNWHAEVFVSEQSLRKISVGLPSILLIRDDSGFRDIEVRATVNFVSPSPEDGAGSSTKGLFRILLSPDRPLPTYLAQIRRGYAARARINIGRRRGIFLLTDRLGITNLRVIEDAIKR